MQRLRPAKRRPRKKDDKKIEASMFVVPNICCLNPHTNKQTKGEEEKAIKRDLETIIDQANELSAAGCTGN
jgi:hypothetical protein